MVRGVKQLNTLQTMSGTTSETGRADNSAPFKKVLTDNLEDIFRTFPDSKMDISEIVAEGESVVVEGAHHLKSIRVSQELGEG